MRVASIGTILIHVVAVARAIKESAPVNAVPKDILVVAIHVVRQTISVETGSAVSSPVLPCGLTTGSQRSLPSDQLTTVGPGMSPVEGLVAHPVWNAVL